jgi:hypothetical protein
MFLSGLAAETDTTAAELTLERNIWLVAAVFIALYREEWAMAGVIASDIGAELEAIGIFICSSSDMVAEQRAARG